MERVSGVRVCGACPLLAWFVAVQVFIALSIVSAGWKLQALGLLDADESWETPPIGETQPDSEDEHR
jgi:hypothetical protein